MMCSSPRRPSSPPAPLTSSCQSSSDLRRSAARSAKRPDCGIPAPTTIGRWAACCATAAEAASASSSKAKRPSRGSEGMGPKYVVGKSPSRQMADDLQSALGAAVGEKYVLAGERDTAPYVTDWRKQYRAPAECVVRPGSTAEVAAVVR